MTNIKKLWIGLAILAVLTPLGLIIPALFGAGGAWGEWGLEEIRKLIGYIPEGMQKLSHIWKSPMPDYKVSGQQQGIGHQSLEYIFTAFIGIIITAGLAYLLVRILGRKNKSE